MEGKEEMTWQQYLTEKVLKECWHSKTEIWAKDICRRCGQLPYDNRTFDNRDDMMDLYETIFKTRKDEWMQFVNYLMGNYGIVASPYIFCLSGEGYEDRCKMVAEFYGWEEK